MQRIALLSDIHGNVPALEAVLADIAASDIDETICLGDLVGYGPDPAGVIDRIRQAGIPTIQGNYDEGVASRRGDCGCHYTTDQDRADGERSYEFTSEAVSQDDADWLLALPCEITRHFEEAKLLFVHGSPRKINEYLLLDRTAEQLVKLADRAGADAVFHGHIHIPYHRAFAVGGWRAGVTEPVERTVHYVSSGSVGKPKDGDSRAAWVEVVLGTAEEVQAGAPLDETAARVGEGVSWLGVAMHRVEYDIESVASAMSAAGLPERLGQALTDA